MAGSATLAAAHRSAGPGRDVTEARCDRRLRVVPHGHAQICSVARSHCCSARPGVASSRSGGMHSLPMAGSGGPGPARHCARVRGPRPRAGSPAVMATYQRGKQAWPLRPVMPTLGRGGWPQTAGRTDWFVPPVGRAVPPAGPWSPTVPGSRARTHHAGAGWSRWQAGHTSLPKASFAQPAATARARLSASPSAAGSAKAAWHPAMAHQAAGTRIWSPMTQCPVIATG